MGKSGPKSKAPGGYGTITPKGYRRIMDPVQQRYRMEHVVVWEQRNGPVPDGFQIHHKNGDKLDNRLDNLELVDPLTHKRTHSGCELRDGEWWKPCNKCGEFQHISHFYKQKGYPHPECRKCCIARATESKRRRREIRKSTSDS